MLGEVDDFGFGQCQVGCCEMLVGGEVVEVVGVYGGFFMDFGIWKLDCCYFVCRV